MVSAQFYLVSMVQGSCLDLILFYAIWKQIASESESERSDIFTFYLDTRRHVDNIVAVCTCVRILWK